MIRSTGIGPALLLGSLWSACPLGIAHAIADIYKWQGDDGRVHFTDRLPAGRPAEKMNIALDAPGEPDGHTGGVAVAGTASDNTARETVVLYGTAWCGMCRQAKAYFRRHGIPYVEYDVEQSAKGKRDYKRLKGKGVPIIVVGNRRMDGFSPAGFQSIYRTGTTAQ